MPDVPEVEVVVVEVPTPVEQIELEVEAQIEQELSIEVEPEVEETTTTEETTTEETATTTASGDATTDGGVVLEQPDEDATTVEPFTTGTAEATTDGESDALARDPAACAADDVHPEWRLRRGNAGANDHRAPLAGEENTRSPTPWTERRSCTHCVYARSRGPVLHSTQLVHGNRQT